MKRTYPFPFFPLLSAGLGGICLLLRTGLYLLEEPSGLLPQNHPLHIASLLISAVTFLLMLRFAISRKDSADREGKFLPPFSAALCIGLSALWMLPAAFESWKTEEGTFGLVWTVFGFLAVGCLLTIACFRLKGRPPHFLFRGILCLYFAIHMLGYYRYWSAMPQLADYLFPLCASVCLSLTAYYRASFDSHPGQYRRLLLGALMSIYFCVCALASPGENCFYLAGALWALADGCAVPPNLDQEESRNVSA